MLLGTASVRSADINYNTSQTVTTRQNLGTGASTLTVADGVMVTFTTPAYTGAGGAINSGVLTFGGSGSFVFQGNSASTTGGAIYATTLTFRGPGGFVFQGNSATQSGGAIYVVNDFSGGLIGSIFRENTSAAAAVYIGGNFSGGIMNSDFVNNIGTTWSSFGGGIGVVGNFTGNISGSSFIGNWGAGNFGGAVAIRGTMYGDIIGSVFRDNTLADSLTPATETHFGGAIGISGTLDGGVYNSEFTNNTARTTTSGGAYGGAISAGSLTGGIHNSVFDGNSAKWGGALALVSGTLSGGINDSTFTNNIAIAHDGVSTGQGGAIYSSASAAGTGITGGINRSSFINNSATNMGGAIITRQISGGINDSFFKNNAAGSNGGAIASLTMLDGGINGSRFYNNSAIGHGGAVLVQAFSNGGVVGSIFEGNSANGTGRGGAIYSVGAVIIDGSQFRDNTAGAVGGAIYVNSGNLSLSTSAGNVIFAGNMQRAAEMPEANAIYLGNASGGAMMTFDVLTGRAITFFDPIQNNTSNGLASVIARGGGIVTFDGSLYSGQLTSQWSRLYGVTEVQGDTIFAVQNNAVFGALAADVDQVALSSFTVDSGAALVGGLAGEVRADNFTLNGILNIAGSALPGSASGGFSTFTVTSNSASFGSGSQILFNTYLNDASVQRTDLLTLILNGSAVHGTADIVVTNVSGTGAVTVGNGIQLVQVTNNDGTTAGAFRLVRPVVAGPYEYTLFHGSIDASGPQNWYLRSVLNCGLAPSQSECQQHFRVETSVYAALPSMALLYGRNLIDTLHERIGEQEDIRGRRDNLHQQTPNTGAWGRVIGTYGKQNGDALGVYGSGPQYNYDFIGLQVGQDLFRYEHADGSRDHVGVYFAYGHASSTVMHFDGATGSNKFDAYTLGGYWTHFDATGWYVDTVLQGTHYDAISTAGRGLQSLTPDGNGIAVSLESGQPLRFVNGYFFEPQAQLIYQTIDFDNASDTKARVQFTKVDSLAGRIGARFGRTWSLDNDMRGGRILTMWIRPNIWREFRGNPLTLFSADDNPSPFRADLRGTWGEINVGASGQIDRTTTLFANVSYHTRFDGNSYAYNGKIGLRLVW